MNSNDMNILLIYVDDMLIASKCNDGIKRLKSKLIFEFEMKDLGSAQRILGMMITRDRLKGVLKINQEGYLEKLVSKFNMAECKSMNVPMAGHFQLSMSHTMDEEKKEMEGVPYTQVVGSIMFSMVSTRPNLSFAISVLNWFISNLGKNHWLVMKWLLRYIKGTTNLGLVYSKAWNCLWFWLDCYVNSDYGGDVELLINILVRTQ